MNEQYRKRLTNTMCDSLVGGTDLLIASTLLRVAIQNNSDSFFYLCLAALIAGGVSVFFMGCNLYKALQIRKKLY